MDAHADTIAHYSVTPAMLRRREFRSRRCNNDGSNSNSSSSSSSSGSSYRNNRSNTSSSSSSIYALLLVGFLHLARGSTDVGSAPTRRGAAPRPPLCDDAMSPPRKVLAVHEAETLIVGQRRSPTACLSASAASAAFALPDDLPRFPKIRPIERPGFLVRLTAGRGERGSAGWERER